jgi:hypothetical protein
MRPGSGVQGADAGRTGQRGHLHAAWRRLGARILEQEFGVAYSLNGVYDA